MKIEINVLIFAFFLFPTIPQVHAQWYGSLNVNNVKVIVRSDGVLFFDGVNGKFIAPYEEGQPEISTMKTAGLWMAGKVAGTDSLRGAIQLYNEGGESDFVPGSLLADSGLPSGLTTKIYQAKGNEITALREDFEDDQIIDDDLGINLLGWPGDNSPYHYDVYGEDLAPVFFGYKNFFDQAGDGVYDPYGGDHPALIIRGCDEFPHYADEMLYFIFNDNVVHTESGMEPLKMEVQTMVYAFDCQESPLGNSLFLRFRLNNRSEVDLDSVYFGLFTDFDIGNPNDDFIGSDVSQSLVYAYNGDEEDEEGYGENAPAMAIDFLRGPLDSARNEQALSHIMPIGDVPFGSGEEYYNLLSGKFQDGGTPPNGSMFYNGNPNIPGEWSEVEEGNTPGERKTLSSYGPFFLKRGAVNEIIVALTFYQEGGNTPLENVQAMYDQAHQVQALFDNCFDVSLSSNCTPSPTAIFEQSKLDGMKVFPNPSTGHVTIEELKAKMEKITLSTFDGKLIFAKELERGQSQVTLKIEDVPAGIYLLEGWEEGIKTAREKLVVLKN